MDAKTLCKHPSTRNFSWWAYDHVLDADVLCVGCCVCGEVLCGAVDSEGKNSGPQKIVKRSKRKTHATQLR